MARRGKKKREAKLCANCGKHSYPSFGDAVGAVCGRQRHGGPPLRIYPCPHGRGVWHMTKQQWRWWDPSTGGHVEASS